MPYAKENLPTRVWRAVEIMSGRRSMLHGLIG